LCLFSFTSPAQNWKAINHQNNNKKAIVVNDTHIVSEYVFTEISELSEGKAYVAKGDLYAYIDQHGNDLSPYVFAEAGNFKDGYALVGDSINRSVINAKMQLVVPFAFFQARLPQLGLILVQSHEGLWGAYDTLGNQRIPCVYDLPPKILSLEKIIVRKNELYGVINDCNEVVFNYSYQYISEDGLGYRSGKYLRLF
jgi:hypothetical protein